jgi:hypothetical protein
VIFLARIDVSYGIAHWALGVDYSDDNAMTDAIDTNRGPTRVLQALVRLATDRELLLAKPELCTRAWDVLRRLLTCEDLVHRSVKMFFAQKFVLDMVCRDMRKTNCGTNESILFYFFPQ